MNSKERHELRYQRRKEKRDKNFKLKFNICMDWDNIFSLSKLVKSYRMCKKGVSWKASVQSFEINLFSNILYLVDTLYNKTWKSKGFHEFTISERGKLRNIKSVDISERCILKSLCKNSIVPLFSNSLIYDNGATIKGKGTDFHINRFKHHLREHYKKYGRKVGVLLFDFTNFFGNINNSKLITMTRCKILNDKIYRLYKKLIFAFGNTGLGLGSEICQISAIYYPNRFDHFIKEILRINCYGRYSDDGYIIHEDVNYLKSLIPILKNYLSKLDIILNEKKTKIVKLNNVITFLKKRFSVSKNGKITCRIGRKMITSERSRIKKMYELYESNKIELLEICKQFHSWLMSIMQYQSHSVRMNMIDYFNNIFSFYGVIFRKSIYHKRKKKCFKKAFIVTRTDVILYPKYC